MAEELTINEDGRRLTKARTRAEQIDAHDAYVQVKADANGCWIFVVTPVREDASRMETISSEALALEQAIRFAHKAAQERAINFVIVPG